jgi:hypothetical protein
MGHTPTLGSFVGQQLQGFLNSRGFSAGCIDGIVGPRTTRALQEFVREKVDSCVEVDGMWGPQTQRAFEAIQGMISDQPTGAQNRIRLVMHTSSRRRSDFYTFEAEAMRIEGDYKRHYPGDQVRRVLVRCGRDIVDTINSCPHGSILSWDILSHSNFGGIHISTDLQQPRRADPTRQARHVQLRRRSARPQDEKDAMFMEEEMRGFYTSRDVARTVADYYNQDIADGTGYLDEVRFDRFADECYVELHGCRTIDRQAPLQYFDDLFIVRLSDEIPGDNTCVGHSGPSYPRGNDGYRHGDVVVFQGGDEVYAGSRDRLRLPNSSTPGDQLARCTPPRRQPQDNHGRPSDMPPRQPRADNYPPPRVSSPPPRRDTYEPPAPRRDQTPAPQPEPQRDIPWGAIINGAAAIGTMIYQSRRERRHRRQERQPRPHDGGGRPAPRDGSGRPAPRDDHGRPPAPRDSGGGPRVGVGASGPRSVLGQLAGFGSFGSFSR